MRTPDLFTGKTKLEEIEALALEEHVPVVRISDPTAIADQAQKTAVRWLGLDAFHEGDDVALALHEDGHGVLVLVAKARDGTERASVTVKLSRAQVMKLAQLSGEIPRSPHDPQKP
jgi:hypothetical protein